MKHLIAIFKDSKTDVPEQRNLPGNAGNCCDPKSFIVFGWLFLGSHIRGCKEKKHTDAVIIRSDLWKAKSRWIFSPPFKLRIFPSPSPNSLCRLWGNRRCPGDRLRCFCSEGGVCWSGVLQHEDVTPPKTNGWKPENCCFVDVSPFPSWECSGDIR